MDPRELTTWQLPVICLDDLDRRRGRVIELVSVANPRSPPRAIEKRFTPRRIPFVEHGQRWLYRDAISCPTGAEETSEISDNNHSARGDDFQAIRARTLRPNFP